MITIPIKSRPNQQIQVDEEDVPLVIGLHWNITAAGYVYCKRDNTAIYIHRLIMLDELKSDWSKVVHHKNGNKLDNRKSNLEVTDQSHHTAQHNIGTSNTKTGYIGVHTPKLHNGYYAQITHKRKKYYLGYFTNAHDAALMRDFWAVEFNGVNARTNFEVVSFG